MNAFLLLVEIVFLISKIDAYISDSRRQNKTCEWIVLVKLQELYDNLRS